MLEQRESQWPLPERIVSATYLDIIHLPTLRPAHVVLEDHAGRPIECPVCGEVDHWRPRRVSGRLLPDSFTCTHIMADEAGQTVRRVATVVADQVGGYLDLNSLIDSAA